MPSHLVRRRDILCALAAGVVVPAASRTSRGDDTRPDALSLARKVEALYAGCRSYRDRGTVASVMRGDDGKDQPADGSAPRTVTTAFARRPDRLRFEYIANRNGRRYRHLIWMDDKLVKTWWDVRPGVETPESLQLALGAAVGVTESASVAITSLLVPTRLARPHALSEGPGELTLLDDEAIGPHRCRRLCRKFEAVNFDSGKKFNVVDTRWVDAKSLLIRRYVNEMGLARGRFVGTIDLEPEIDVDIPPGALAFDPPADRR